MKQINIDLTYLQTIAGDDPVFIKEMLQMIVDTTPEEVQNIVTYFEKQDYHMMASAAHKIKAPIQMLGDDYAVELLLQIEQLAKESTDKDELSAIVKEASIHLNNIVEEVRKVLLTL